MDEFDSLRKIRVNKLKSLEKMGIDPFPAKSSRTHTTKEANKSFNSFSKQRRFTSNP